MNVGNDSGLNYFTCCMVFYWAVKSLIQNFMGKEAYINAIDAGLIDGAITIPLAIIALILVVLEVKKWI